MSTSGEAPRAGARRGARRGARPQRSLQPRLLLLGLGGILTLAAWGFLVWAAIDFGRTGRGGDSTAWWYLALASVGAVACLFLSLMLFTQVLRAVGILAEKKPHRH